MKNLEDYENVWTTGLDDTAINLYCDCRENPINFSVFEDNIYRCPVCGKGFRSEIEFRIFVYEPDERDAEHEEYDAVKKRVDAQFEEMRREQNERFMREHFQREKADNGPE